MSTARNGATQPLLDNSSQGSPFRVTKEQLAALVDPKSPEKLKALNGAKKICEALRVDPSVGLSPDEGGSEPFADRRKAFGKNASLVFLLDSSQINIYIYPRSTF